MKMLRTLSILRCSHHRLLELIGFLDLVVATTQLLLAFEFSQATSFPIIKIILSPFHQNKFLPNEAATRHTKQTKQPNAYHYSVSCLKNKYY